MQLHGLQQCNDNNNNAIDSTTMQSIDYWPRGRVRERERAREGNQEGTREEGRGKTMERGMGV